MPNFPLTIRVFHRDGVVEVCGGLDDVLEVVKLMWHRTPRMTVGKGTHGASANWTLGEVK